MRMRNRLTVGMMELCGLLQQDPVLHNTLRLETNGLFLLISQTVEWASRKTGNRGASSVRHQPTSTELRSAQRGRVGVRGGAHEASQDGGSCKIRQFRGSRTARREKKEKEKERE